MTGDNEIETGVVGDKIYRREIDAENMQSGGIKTSQQTTGRVHNERDNEKCRVIDLP